MTTNCNVPYVFTPYFRRVKRGLCYDLMHCRDDRDLFCERICAKFGDEKAMEKIRAEENRRRRKKQKHKGTGRRNSNSIARDGYYYY